MDDTEFRVLNAIADRWGGVGCDREFMSERMTFTHRTEDGFAERYVVTYPDVATEYYEDSGRPFKGRTPKDKFVVRALWSAPDDFFEVGIDGVYEGHNGTINLLGS
jgi:hypothetical protein